jgi:hypothetical protein
VTTAKTIGILLIAAGALGLTYGGFNYMKEDTRSAELAPVVLQEKDSVYAPIAVGAAALALGLLLLIGSRKP